MKKRFLVFCLILFTCLVYVFPISQKYYSISSEEWRMVNHICQSAGVLGPSSIGPVSSSELNRALDRIDRSTLSRNDMVLYEVYRSRLYSENTQFAFSDGFIEVDIPLSYEMYLQTDDSACRYHDIDWIVAGYSNRKGLMALRLEVGIADIVYGKLEFPVLNMYQKTHFNSIFSDNIPDVMSSQVPFEAGFNIGNDNLSLIVARDAMSYGNGYTGNLFIGDNFDYQEFIKFSFANRYYEGTLSLTYFDQQVDEGVLPEINGLDSDLYFYSHRFSGPHQIRLATTHTANILDKFSATLMLGTMIQSDSAFDFRMLNPFMYFHNMGNFTGETIFEANNFTSLNFIYNFLPKWSLSGQIVMDQFQLGSEVKDFGDRGYLEPNAYGVLLNCSYTDVIKDGMFDVYLEGVYTSPALYLNEKYIDQNGNVISRAQFEKRDEIPDGYHKTWNQDLIVGYYRPFWNNKLQVEGAGYGDVSYTGYKYGPDTAVISLGCSYDIPDLISVSGSILYKAHGEKGIPYYPGQDMTFEGLTNENYNKLSFVGETVEHSLEIKVEADWEFYEGLSFYTGLGYVHRWNYRNVAGNSFDDLQCAIGFTINPVEFGLSFCK